MRTKQKQNTDANRTIMHRALSDSRYKGKHVIVVRNKILTARTGAGAVKILHNIDKKYPNEMPAVTYIPDADTLILRL